MPVSYGNCIYLLMKKNVSDFDVKHYHYDVYIGIYNISTNTLNVYENLAPKDTYKLMVIDGKIFVECYKKTGANEIVSECYRFYSEDGEFVKIKYVKQLIDD